VELHASTMTSRAITIPMYPAESRDYACFAPLRHYRNSLSNFHVSQRFSPDCPQELAGRSLQFNFKFTDDDSRRDRNVHKMSFTSFSLAVIFIIKTIIRNNRIVCEIQMLETSHNEKQGKAP